MISNNAYYELFASYTVPDHNRVGYWVDLGANSKGKVIKTYNENLKKWVKVTDATSEDAVAPFIGNNGNWWIDNRDTGINASGHSPYIGDNSNWFVYSSERNEHIDTGLPSRGEAGPKGDKGDKGNDATINGVGSIKIEAGDNITITQSDDTLTIIGDVQKPDLSNYATKTEVTKLDNKLQDAVSSVFRAKGSVKTYNNLPVDKVSIGDVYNVLDTGANYVAISINPITWDKLSETVDLSKFFNKEEINSLLSTKVDKQEGKQLTTEDFTTVLKRKLEGLSNYNDTEIRNAIDSLESAFNTLVEGNATVAIDTFNEIVAFLKNVENSQDLDSIIAGINTTISKVEAKIPDTNNFLSKDGGTMNNTNLVGNLNAELLNGYSSDKFVNIHNLINGTATDALTVGLNAINQDYLWTNTPYSDIATLVDISYSPDWRSLFFISPSTGRIHTRFKHNGDTWTNWKEIAFTDGTIANSLKLNGISSGYDSLNGFIPVVGIGREMEIGSYLDFHLKGGEEKDYSTRLVCSGNTMNEVNLPLSNGTLALLSDTVAAAKNFIPRYITNLNTDGINEFFSSCFQADNRPTTRNNYATGFTVYNDELAFTYQFAFDSYGDVHTRYKTSTEWQPWYEIITSNNIGRQTVEKSYALRENTSIFGKENIDAFLIHGEIKFATFQEYEEIGFKSNDGLILSIPWSLNGYGVQLAFDEAKSATMKIRGKEYTWGDWYQIWHSGCDGSGSGLDADLLDGLHESAFLRYRGETGTDQESTLWHSLGIKQYINALPDGLTGVYNYGEVISLTGAQARFDMYVAHTTTDTHYEHGIWVRSGWVDDKKPWRRLAFITDTIAAANKLSATRYLWGRPFDGSGDVSGDMTNVGIINNYFNFQKGTGSNAVLHAESIMSDVDYIHVHVSNLDNYHISRPLVLQYGYGNVGIGITTPEYKLDVNGDAIIRGSLHTIDHILLDGTDQINGKWGGIALNYNCGKYVDTSIWDGQANTIMRVFGEGRQVAIGAHSVDTPRGTLNVDGDVYFENARFITTSGFVDGDHPYSHAIYGGFHGIDVCEFYESEFRFKVNGGSITSLNLTPDDAIFNGAIQTHSCQYAGLYNGKARFWLGRDGSTDTWLQGATDTTNGGGRLYMSGYGATVLSEFNVYASKSTYTGNILAHGDVTAYSDIRLKNRIESVNNVLDTISTLDVFRYTWKDREDKSVHIGVSAQQVQTIYPEFVLTSSSEDGTDYLTVNYAALATCIAIQGIKELVKKGDERDKRIAALEEEVISLKEQLRYGNK